LLRQPLAGQAGKESLGGGPIKATVLGKIRSAPAKRTVQSELAEQARGTFDGLGTGSRTFSPWDSLRHGDVSGDDLIL
jgi:hypothetical protein